jgi:hypothetical protein
MLVTITGVQMRFCEVLVELSDPSGDAVSGARVTARLSAPIVGDSFVMASPERAVTDSAGRCSLSLVPNSFGAKPTTYTFEILLPGSLRAITHKGIDVPDVGVITLNELLGGAPRNRVLIEWDDEALWVDALPWDDGQIPVLVERWNDEMTWDDTATAGDGEVPLKVRIWGDPLVWNDTQIWSA